MRLEGDYRDDPNFAQDITHLFDVSSYFKEFLQELKLVRGGADMQVKVGDQQYRLGEVTKAFETLYEYVQNNKEMLKQDPELLEKYLEDGFVATGGIAWNPIMKEKAIQFAQQELN